LGYPLALKPIAGNHGRGITTNVKNMEDAIEALRIAKEHSRRVIVEQFITGFDHRVLVINYKFEAAAVRKPACVVGDGKSTIQELIDKVNEDPRRGFGHEKVLTAITVNDQTINFLKDQGLTVDSVPEKDQEILVKPTANLSTGGTAEDITDQVHPSIITMCERVARIIGLDICGIDIMAPSLFKPMKETGGAILEVNAAPGFRMHLEPTHGLPRNVAEPVIDMLFPNRQQGDRIPIIAISGTN
jgi:cyanophycin synthetase